MTTTITIQPVSGVATIQANASANTATSRSFRITGASANLTLNGLIVRHGGNSSVSFDGGCISVDGSGTLTVNNTTVEHCYGRFGGGISASSATLAVTGGSIIRFNQASRDGGGIDSDLSTVTITNSTISNNINANPSNNGAGGGLTVLDATLMTISGSTFSNNTVGSTLGGLGGAIYYTGFAGGSGSITNSVFTGNSASGGTTNNGGAIYYGGTDPLTISDSRFESNTASNLGDAIYNVANVNLTITHSCFTNNGDTAVYDSTGTGTITANGGGNLAQSNWWGTSWGPRITGVPSDTSSYVSNGDSINGNGATVVSNQLVDVDLTTNPTDQSQPPTGSWLTVAPTVAGATCQTCTDVSSAGHARSCG